MGKSYRKNDAYAEKFRGQRKSKKNNKNNRRITDNESDTRWEFQTDEGFR